MNISYTFCEVTKLPDNWDNVVALENRLLSSKYLLALFHSLPINMEIEAIAFYNENELMGGALLQNLSFNKHNTFQVQDSVTCSIRNRIVRQLASKITLLGNNMITGQNGFHFKKKESISIEEAVNYMHEAMQMYCKKKRTKLWVWKDYTAEQIDELHYLEEKNYSQFEVQPAMELKISKEWNSFEDYYALMTKKYRARIRTARKKSTGIEREFMGVELLEKYQSRMYDLYKSVANNADFNTFFLAKNHFIELKKHLGEDFQVMGYFENGGLVGFCTFLDNYAELETYFLGYENEYQKSHQLYLNMLLDMAEWGINQKKYTTINYGRTALEIKSSIGANAVQLYGLIKHRNRVINNFVHRLLLQMSPDYSFVERNPFKSTELIEEKSI